MLFFGDDSQQIPQAKIKMGQRYERKAVDVDETDKKEKNTFINLCLRFNVTPS